MVQFRYWRNKGPKLFSSFWREGVNLTKKIFIGPLTILRIES